MPKYHIWTVGCQMNEADSARMAGALEKIGCEHSENIEDADVVVLNSCVVRQGVEDKVAGRLNSLKPLKRRDPDKTIALMGCMVGPRDPSLQERFPHVDLFLRPQAFDPLIRRLTGDDGTCLDNLGPILPTKAGVTVNVPIIHGCDKFCTFCIIPYRRGRERSRPIPELVEEVSALGQKGVKEVTLLGQNVDSYGQDLDDNTDLADLLEALDPVDGIERIRFLTSHPNDMSQKLIEAVADLPKVCEHINLPIQAGDDEVLATMHRGYTSADYLELTTRIRDTIPGVSMSTDIIVGFANETEAQFQRTVDVLEEVRFDKVHVAPYSLRPGTIAFRKIDDSLEQDEKMRRLHVIEEVQKRIATEINEGLIGSRQQVLVERRHKGKWQGRTRTNKLVFLDVEDDDLTGTTVDVRIVESGPWSLQGVPARDAVAPGRRN